MPPKELGHQFWTTAGWGESPGDMRNGRGVGHRKVLLSNRDKNWDYLDLLSPMDHQRDCPSWFTMGRCTDLQDWLRTHTMLPLTCALSLKLKS